MRSEWPNTETNYPEELWSLLLGDLQKPPGGSPEHPAVGVPAWTGVGPYWESGILFLAGHGKSHLRQAASIWELQQGYLGDRNGSLQGSEG